MGLLNRRHLRIKVLQALYAYYQSNNVTPSKGEKELLFSIDKIYELYIRLLLTFQELKEVGLTKIEENKNKHLPSADDLNPNLRFVNNRIIALLENSVALNAESKALKVSWGGEETIIRKLFTQISQSSEYQEFIDSEDSFDSDRDFLMKIFKKHVANYKSIHEILEEQSIYWLDDLDLICVMVLKTLRDLPADADEYFPLLPLYKDQDDDSDFIKRLFRSSLRYKEEHEPLIDSKAGNWELDRIALMDMILMNMALSEAREFSNVPLKVTMNEYIEISKFYSTPKSNGFINGILDKLFSELKEKGEIRKTGRGLID